MIKVFTLTSLLILVAINFLIAKKIYALFSFYLQIIPRNPYLKLAKEIKVGQTIDIEQMKADEISHKNSLTVVAISIECSKCKELINSFPRSNLSFNDFLFLSNGKIPEPQRNILIDHKISFVESEKVFNDLGVRSVPKAIKIEDNIILSVNNISNVDELSLI
ncbi:hypothetical protein D0S48_10880 [Psychrobacillus sp. AK 1817]|uniref:hypothetical protein n=1 Tax=Psychrobacillus sp. AK 1817 TaxID=2303505 RepID=UPI001243CBF3|nr:hypothetical protein [Psychrobacillus sp. AK 1817]QEY21157.1 hypothetical protein D0S48_10880 [Psychrobacillus sp. AK 1817]